MQHAIKPAAAPTKRSDLSVALRRQDWVKARQLAERLPNPQAPEIRFAALFAATKHNPTLPIRPTDVAALRSWQQGAPLLGLLESSEPLKATEFSQSSIKSLSFDALAVQTRALLDTEALSHAQLALGAKAIARLLRLSRSRKPRQLVFRELRARFRRFTRQVTASASDWRWLAVHGPDPRHLDLATAGLKRLPGKHALRGTTLLLRSHQRAEDGDPKGAEQALDLAATLGVSVKPGLRYYRSGLSHYRARNYHEAAPLLEAASRNPNRHSAQARYYAANAWSRLARSDNAIALYQRTIKGRPLTSLNERAQLQLAREYRHIGRFAESTREYLKFLQTYPNRPLTQTARREYGVTQFLLGYPLAAARTFERLAQHEEGTREGRAYEQLFAVSHQFAGNKVLAKAIYRRLAKTSPMEASGLFSRRRLAALGEHIPEPIAVISREQDAGAPALPALVKTLDSLGLDSLAEGQLKRFESQLAEQSGDARAETSCKAYETIQYGRRRFEIGYALATQDWRYKTQGRRPPWLWRCLYPKPFAASVRPAAEVLEVPEHLIYAIMRQESGFRPGVVSPAKAFGLMQVIEPTANSVLAAGTRSLKERTQSLTKRTTIELLKVPDANIWIGTSYLAELRSKFENKTHLVAAAYNAGPEAASRWVYAMQDAPVELFIAGIPYKETRHYVGRVLLNEAAYLAAYPISKAPVRTPERQE